MMNTRILCLVGLYVVTLEAACLATDDPFHTTARGGRGASQPAEMTFHLLLTDSFDGNDYEARHDEQRRNAEAQACSLLNTRRWMPSHYKINADDPAAVQSHYDSFKDKTEYNAAMALNYIKRWPQYGDLRKEVTAREKDAQASRIPVPHTYAIVRVSSGN